MIFSYKQYLRAFTLAEVLVTLGIIGVVSAMTVPTLMQNYQRKSYVTQLHKVYNELQQAAQQYMTDRNAVNLREAGLTSTDALSNFVKTYFKVVNDCGSDKQPCFAPNYKKISGTDMGQGTGQPLNMTIASGASFGFGVSSSGTGDNNRVAIFDVDINGPQGPNIAGRDVFILGLFNNGMVDEYALTTAPGDKDTRENLFNTNCNSSNTTWTGCFGKILNDNWEMTY
jgi:prepilin-type N-terminal cleavage/methylation domain-containing protein